MKKYEYRTCELTLLVDGKTINFATAITPKYEKALINAGYRVVDAVNRAMKRKIEQLVAAGHVVAVLSGPTIGEMKVV